MAIYALYLCNTLCSRNGLAHQKCDVLHKWVGGILGFPPPDLCGRGCFLHVLGCLLSSLVSHGEHMIGCFVDSRACPSNGRTLFWCVLGYNHSSFLVPRSVCEFLPTARHVFALCIKGTIHIRNAMSCTTLMIAYLSYRRSLRHTYPCTLDPSPGLPVLGFPPPDLCGRGRFLHVLGCLLSSIVRHGERMIGCFVDSRACPGNGRIAQGQTGSKTVNGETTFQPLFWCVLGYNHAGFLVPRSVCGILPAARHVFALCIKGDDSHKKCHVLHHTDVFIS